MFRNSIFALSVLLSSCILLSHHGGARVSGAIAGNRERGNNMLVRQDEDDAGGAEGEGATGGEGGEETETATIDPETITGPDRFIYGFNALVKAVEVFFQKIDKKVEKKVMALEDFLNLIHDQVHVNGTEDFHETAYITMKV